MCKKNVDAVGMTSPQGDNFCVSCYEKLFNTTTCPDCLGDMELLTPIDYQCLACGQKFAKLSDTTWLRFRAEPIECDKCCKNEPLTLAPFIFVTEGCYEKKWLCVSCMEMEKSIIQKQKEGMSE